MHATDLVRINGITRVLLVYTCQQGAYPQGLYLKPAIPLGRSCPTVNNLVTILTMVAYSIIYHGT
jgi:hypothetical protein